MIETEVCFDNWAPGVSSSVKITTVDGRLQPKPEGETEQLDQKENDTTN